MFHMKHRVEIFVVITGIHKYIKLKNFKKYCKESSCSKYNKKDFN